MKREAVIRLDCNVRDDGSIHVCSPDIPLFHVVGTDAAHAQALAVEVLKEHLSLNYNIHADIRPAEPLESFLAHHETATAIPAHVIAEMAM